MKGKMICDAYGLEDEVYAHWFTYGVNHCFYYHPEWFNHKFDFTEEELEDWRESFEEANL